MECARDLARLYRIPVTSSAHAQMHIAGLLGNKFSIVDISGSHNMQMYHLVVRYRMTDRCASIRNAASTPAAHAQTIPTTGRSHVGARPRASRAARRTCWTPAVKDPWRRSKRTVPTPSSWAARPPFWLQPLLQKRSAWMIGWDRAGAGGRTRGHRGCQDAGRSRCRCQRARLSRRAAGEVAAAARSLQRRADHDRQAAGLLAATAADWRRSGGCKSRRYPSGARSALVVPRAQAARTSWRLLQPCALEKLGARRAGHRRQPADAAVVMGATIVTKAESRRCYTLL